LCRSE
jgi:hypothetical protein